MPKIRVKDFFEHPSAAIDGIFAALAAAMGVDESSSDAIPSWKKNIENGGRVGRGGHAREMPSHRDSPVQ